MNKNIKYGLGLIIVGFVLCTEITGVFPLLNRSGSVNVTNLVFFLINFCAALGYIFIGVRDLKQDRILKKEQELEIKRKKELKAKRATENKKKREEKIQLAKEHKLSGEFKSKFLNNQIGNIEDAVQAQELFDQRNNELDSHNIINHTLRKIYLSGNTKLEIVKVAQGYNLSSSQEHLLFKLLGSSSLKNTEKPELVVVCEQLIKWGVKMCNVIQSRKVIQGMTKEQLSLSLGRALKDDETVYKNTTKNKLFYNKYITRQNKKRYKFRVDLEGGLVVGWKEGNFRD